jgi:hypothetical protein
VLDSTRPVASLEGLCLEINPSKIEGRVAGEVARVGELSTSSELVFQKNNPETPKIKAIERSVGDMVVNPDLKISGTTYNVTIAGAIKILFEEHPEVTKGE